MLMDLLYIATSSGTENFVAGELPLKKSKKIFQLLSTGVLVGLFFGRTFPALMIFWVGCRSHTL